MVVAESDQALRRVLMLEPTAPWIASTGVVPADIFRRLGGFDEELSMSADADLAVRVLLGSPAVAVRDPVALYRQHGGQMHLNTIVLEHDMKIVIDKAFASSSLPDSLRGAKGAALSSLGFCLGAQAFAKGKYFRAVRYWARGLADDLPLTLRLLRSGVARRARSSLRARPRRRANRDGREV
jgi:GT2 family glycosyltransferase